MAGLAGAWIALAVFVILPAFNGVGFFRFGSGELFGGLGEHWADAGWFLERLGESGAYLWALGAPLLFLFLIAPLSAAPALPALFLNLLSDVPYTRSMQFHYNAWILPFLFVGVVDGLARLERNGRLAGPLRASLSSALVIAVLAANEMWAIVPLDELGRVRAYWASARTDTEYRRVAEALASIPADAAVSADYSLVPHLSHRERIYMYPNPFETAQWGVAGEGGHDPDTVQYLALRTSVIGEYGLAGVARLVSEGEFERYADYGDLELYRRPPSAIPREDRRNGDLDGSGAVDQRDVLNLTHRIVAGRTCPLPLCDLDGNGTATLTDVRRLQALVREVPPDTPGP